MKWNVKLTPALGVIPVEVNQILSQFDHAEVEVVISVESEDPQVIAAIEDAATEAGVTLEPIR